MILVGAVGVIAWRNPVHAALSLIMTLFGVAVLFIEQQADFLAAVQIIVYAGAIVVLFFFVIMFLGVDRTERPHVEPLVGQRAFAALGVLVIVGSAHRARWPSAHWVPADAHSTVGTDHRSLRATSTRSARRSSRPTSSPSRPPPRCLIIAVVGAVVLARRSGAATPTSPAEPELERADDPGDRGGGAMSIPASWYLVLVGAPLRHRRLRRAHPAQRRWSCSCASS